MVGEVLKKKKQEAGNSDVGSGSRQKGIQCMKYVLCLTTYFKYVVFCQLVLCYSVLLLIKRAAMLSSSKMKYKCNVN